MHHAALLHVPVSLGVEITPMAIEFTISPVPVTDVPPLKFKCTGLLHTPGWNPCELGGPVGQSVPQLIPSLNPVSPQSKSVVHGCPASGPP